MQGVYQGFKNYNAGKDVNYRGNTKELIDKGLTAPLGSRTYENAKDAAEKFRDNEKAPSDEGAGGSSIVAIKGEKGDYGIGVLLDADAFDGVKPRNWNKIVEDFVYENLAGKEMVAYDVAGNEEIISFAGRGERATKDGANNSHRVIDKLVRSRGNINALNTIHIDEILRTASAAGDVSDNTHKWLDQNGWEFKTAYVQDIKGNIYETTLNIAKARDGRKILYAFSNTKRVDGGDVSSIPKKGDSHTTFNSGNSIAPKGDAVNTLYMQEGGSYSIARKSGATMEQAQKLFNELTYNGELTDVEKLREIYKKDPSLFGILRDVVEGYIHTINSSSLTHIEKRHGKNVYSNEFNGKNNTQAPLILYTKKIDGTYYAAVAVAENSYKKLWIASAYTAKTKEDITQVLHDEISSLGTTSETAPASLSSISNISQKKRRCQGRRTPRKCGIEGNNRQGCSRH